MTGFDPQKANWAHRVQSGSHSLSLTPPLHLLQKETANLIQQKSRRKKVEAQHPFYNARSNRLIFLGCKATLSPYFKQDAYDRNKIMRYFFSSERIHSSELNYSNHIKPRFSRITILKESEHSMKLGEEWPYLESHQGLMGTASALPYSWWLKVAPDQPSCTGLPTSCLSAVKTKDNKAFKIKSYHQQVLIFIISYSTFYWKIYLRALWKQSATPTLQNKEEITTFAFLCPPITSQIPHTYSQPKKQKGPNNIWTKDVASWNGSNIHLRNVTEF